MRSEPVVSFVVLCYNLAAYVGECIDSILAQKSDVPFEVVVIDDASTDHSAEVLARFDDPRVRVIRHATNAGHARTVNEGISLARGEFIARMDADDRYRPEFLSKTIAIFEANPDVDLVYGDVCIINDQGRVTVAQCDVVHGGKAFKGRELIPLLERNFICSPSVIARREAWLRVPPVPDHLPFHDWYFTVSMARKGLFYFLNEVIADYRVHDNNLHSAIAADGREERGVHWLLQSIFDQQEADPILERGKRRARRRIYASHHFDAAEKYFGCNRWADARRCYGRALAEYPSIALRRGLIRHWLATLLLTPAAYSSLKRSIGVSLTVFLI